MGFWERVLHIITRGQGVADPMEHWVYVRCDKCGEPLRARVDLRSELSASFGEKREDTTYFCRKVVVGSSGCYNPIEVRLTFDATRNLVRREISGGSFILEREYLDEASAEDLKHGRQDSTN